MAVLEVCKKMLSLTKDKDAFNQEISKVARRFKIAEDELLSALNDMAENIEMELERYALAQIHN
jgi:transcriptional regulator GlxA family with amidase domain